jgi:sugar phosphate isomerase/epimerase
MRRGYVQVRRRRVGQVIRIGMSTSCVHPWNPRRAFALAKRAGYDGLEIMVTKDKGTQDPASLIALCDRYELPILSVHAPVLLLTQLVWGQDPRVKLERSAELARAVGAGTVVVHPPFHWQSRYADEFLDGVSRTAREYGVTVAVENMFPWTIRGRAFEAYSPGWDVVGLDCDAVTLDFSHAALAGQNSLEMAQQLGPRLRHLHLCDGPVPTADGTAFDEHLAPGAGSQPVAETLRWLADGGWDGQIVAEVSTRRLRDEDDRLEALRSALEFARLHTAAAEAAAPRAVAPDETAIRDVSVR